jgi:hypothetical protein
MSRPTTRSLYSLAAIRCGPLKVSSALAPAAGRSRRWWKCRPGAAHSRPDGAGRRQQRARRGSRRANRHLRHRVRATKRSRARPPRRRCRGRVRPWRRCPARRATSRGLRQQHRHLALERRDHRPTRVCSIQSIARRASGPARVGNASSSTSPTLASNTSPKLLTSGRCRSLALPQRGGLVLFQRTASRSGQTRRTTAWRTQGTDSKARRAALQVDAEEVARQARQRIGADRGHAVARCSVAFERIARTVNTGERVAHFTAAASSVSAAAQTPAPPPPFITRTSSGSACGRPALLREVLRVAMRRVFGLRRRRCARPGAPAAGSAGTVARRDAGGAADIGTSECPVMPATGVHLQQEGLAVAGADHQVGTAPAAAAERAVGGRARGAGSRPPRTPAGRSGTRYFTSSVKYLFW